MKLKTSGYILTVLLFILGVANITVSIISDSIIDIINLILGITCFIVMTIVLDVIKTINHKKIKSHIYTIVMMILILTLSSSVFIYPIILGVVVILVAMIFIYIIIYSFFRDNW